MTFGNTRPPYYENKWRGSYSDMSEGRSMTGGRRHRGSISMSSRGIPAGHPPRRRDPAAIYYHDDRNRNSMYGHLNNSKAGWQPLVGTSSIATGKGLMANGKGDWTWEEAEAEMEEMEHKRRIKRIVVYAAYGLLAAVIVVGCILAGYFGAPRSPAVTLSGINTAEPSEKFKLQGTKMQFKVELQYHVQNDNFYEMTVDDISAAMFWPDTRLALGGGRLSGVTIPARRTAQITMPITIKYDVKRGPPPVLLGLVESCGLHDAGVGELNLDVEVQADVHTRAHRASFQGSRQTVAVRCPARHLATLQVNDGTSGNIGDIVRTLNV